MPAGDSRFATESLPVWIAFEAGLCGIPDIDRQGFEVGIDQHGPEIAPDAVGRLVGSAVVARVRAFFERRFPAMMRAPLVDARVCHYENTATGDFLIDRHPANTEGDARMTSLSIMIELAIDLPTIAE